MGFNYRATNHFPAALAAIVLAASACGGEKSATRSDDVNGGTVVISASGDPEILFPPLASTVPAKIIIDMVYDHLAEIGDSLNTVGDEGFKPRLASSWTWSDDSLAIAFHIDSAARWHDGARVTAADVVATWHLYSDPDNASPYAGSLASIDSVTARDSLTAVFFFRTRSPMQFYDAVNAMSIMPAHAIGDARGPALRTLPIARNPVGSGRFRFTRWTPGASVEISADTGNYRGRPGLDRVVMAIASDFNAALVRLLGGEADVLEQVPAANIAEVARDSSLTLSLSPGLDYNFVQLNLRDPKNRNRPHRIFADRELRRALTAAVDRRGSVRNAYDSLANVAIGPTVRAFPTTDTTLRQISHSLDGARRTLDSLGWRDTNADGIRERTGTPLAFTLTVPTSSKTRNAIAVLMQEQLRQAGVRMDIEQLDFTAFIDRETRRDFDAVFGGWRVEASPGGIRQTWGSAGSRGGKGTNYGSYENATFDALVDSALAAGTLDLRRTYFTKAYQTIIDDAPAIWFAEPRRVMALHRRIRTRGLRADAWWANLADWTISPERRIARDRVPAAK